MFVSSSCGLPVSFSCEIKLTALLTLQIIDGSTCSKLIAPDSPINSDLAKSSADEESSLKQCDNNRLRLITYCKNNTYCANVQYYLIKNEKYEHKFY